MKNFLSNEEIQGIPNDTKELKFDHLMEAAFEAIIIHDQGRIVEINQAAADMFGYTRDELISMDVSEISSVDSYDIVKKKIRERSAGPYEATGLKKDGTRVHCEIRAKMFNLQGQLVRVAAIRDITESKHSELVNKVAYKIAEAALSTDDLNVLMGSIHGFIGELIPVNNFYIALYDSINNMISFPYFRDQFDEKPERKKPGRGLTEYVLRTGESLLATPGVFDQLENLGEVTLIGRPSVDWLGIPLKRKDKTIGIIAVQSYSETERYDEEDKKILTFVSAQVAMAIERKRAEEERQKLEEQLRQAQKMEAIGTLAGGIAHDFNNILSAIIGYGELTSLHVKENKKAQAHIQKMLKASGRARETIKQILAFSRKETKEKKPIILSRVLLDAMNLLKSTLPSTIRIQSDVDCDLGPVIANSTEIHQVIMNLATNASHAMRKKGGVLEVVLKELNIFQGKTRSLNLQPGRYQRLTISDTGHGIPREIINRIFEPYFTTKNREEGTGMGLAVVHGIVKSHDGEISLYSEPGKGTTFHLFFPVANMDNEIQEKEAIAQPVQGGDEKILLVDDDMDLSYLGNELLSHLGYRVTSVNNSLEALEIFKKNPAKFNLVVSDQTMPNMTGVELATEIKSIRSDLPVILCTGFSENINRENYQSKGIDCFIMKPYTMEEMGHKVRSLLDSKKKS